MGRRRRRGRRSAADGRHGPEAVFRRRDRDVRPDPGGLSDERQPWRRTQYAAGLAAAAEELAALVQQRNPGAEQPCLALGADGRSEEHTSELQSLMRISYAVFCLKKKKEKENIFRK